MLEARDLPRCEISDFLQERLDNALAAERVQRAKEQGLSPKQVRPFMCWCQGPSIGTVV